MGRGEKNGGGFKSNAMRLPGVFFFLSSGYRVLGPVRMWILGSVCLQCNY